MGKIDLFEEMLSKLPDWHKKIIIEIIEIKKNGGSLVINHLPKEKIKSHLSDTGSSNLCHSPDQ